MTERTSTDSGTEIKDMFKGKSQKTTAEEPVDELQGEPDVVKKD
jgi:hypothetical protein